MRINRFAGYALSLVTVLLLTTPASAQVPRFDAFYAFGDSLADNGNDFITTSLIHANPPVPPSVSPHKTYFNGRFSNGYVAFEYLWQRLSGNALNGPHAMKPSLANPLFGLDDAVDFAFGGTGTPYLDQTPGGFFAPGLKGQVELFRAGLRGRKPSKRALYAIVTGSNDYGNHPGDVPTPIDVVVGNIVDSVERLYALGARDVMVLNLPDLGIVPVNAADPVTAAAATALSSAHNAALKIALDDLQLRYPKLHLIQADLIDAFFHLPALNPFVPALAVPPGNPLVAACLFIDPITCTDHTALLNVDLGYLFYDIVHPTTEAHRSLSDYLYSVLRASYGH